MRSAERVPLVTSALGHKRTLASELEMSAYPSRADTLSGSIDVC